MEVKEYAIHLSRAVERILSDEDLSGNEIHQILENALAEQPAHLYESHYDKYR